MVPPFFGVARGGRRLESLRYPCARAGALCTRNGGHRGRLLPDHPGSGPGSQVVFAPGPAGRLQPRRPSLLPAWTALLVLVVACNQGRKLYASARVLLDEWWAILDSNQ